MAPLATAALTSAHTPAAQHLVLGAEAACWGRCLSQHGGVAANALLPTLAVAERMWRAGDTAFEDVEVLAARLDAARAFAVALAGGHLPVPSPAEYDAAIADIARQREGP